MSALKGDQDVIRFVRIQPVHSCVVVGMVIKCIPTDKLAEVQDLYTMTLDLIKYLMYFTYCLRHRVNWIGLGLLDPILGLIL